MLNTSRHPDEREHSTVERVVLPRGGTTVELVHAHYRTQRFALHWHDDFTLVLVERGAVRTRVGRDFIVAPAGSILLLEPGVVHGGESADAGGYSIRSFRFPERTLQFSAGIRLAPHITLERTTDVGSPVQFAHAVIDDTSLARQLRFVHAWLLHPDADLVAAEMSLDSALRQLVARWGGAHGTRLERACPGLARSVRSYLDANIERNVSLSELAQVTRRSPFYLSRIFRSAFGLPPHAYLAVARVERACQLLAEGLPHSMVAHATGFSDQSHFIRQFKRVTGVTPGRYVRSLHRAVGRRTPALLSSAG